MTESTLGSVCMKLCKNVLERAVSGSERMVHLGTLWFSISNVASVEHSESVHLMLHGCNLSCLFGG